MEEPIESLQDFCFSNRLNILATLDVFTVLAELPDCATDGCGDFSVGEDCCCAMNGGEDDIAIPGDYGDITIVCPWFHDG